MNVHTIRSVFFLAHRLGVMVVVGMMAIAAATSATHAFAGDKPLKNPLVLRLSQTGFAGVTGTEYTLMPNGDYEIRTFVNDQFGDTVQTGQLQPETLFPISQEFTAADMKALPSRTIGYEGVNPSTVEITYEGNTAAAIMPPGYAFGEACPDKSNQALCRFLELAGTVQKSMAPQ